MSDLFPLPPSGRDDDTHWDVRAAQVMSTMADDGSFLVLATGTRAWLTATVLAAAAAILILLPLHRQELAIETLVQPDEAIARMMTSATNPPSLAAMLLGADNSGAPR